MKSPSKETIYALQKVNKRHFQELRKADLRANRLLAKAEAQAKKLERRDSEYKTEQGNNFRQQLSDERAQYLTRDEYTIHHGALVDRVGEVEKTLGSKIETGLAPLNAFMASQEGKSSGVDGSRAILYGVVIVILMALAAVSPHIH